MGEIANMMLEGVTCESCGEFLGNAVGHPQKCPACSFDSENPPSDRWAKRADNRKKSKKILEQKGLKFTSHNNGAHLIVKGPAYLVDFWPGTGKYMTREGYRRIGRGVFNLISLLRGAETPQKRKE